MSQAQPPNDAASDAAVQAPAWTEAELAERFEIVAGVITSLRPVIQADGGDVELLDLTPEGVIRVRLKGACVGCPSASMTLRDGIERSVREKVPGITGIQALDG